MKLLNKSHLKLWASCPRKLYYDLNGYANANDDNAFLQYLASEGKVVGMAARNLFAGGKLVETADHLRASESTNLLLNEGDAVIFEACFMESQLLARPDVFVRRGNTIWLGEAKSSVGDSAKHDSDLLFVTKAGKIRSAWREILLDIAFQAHVVGRRFPDCLVRPFLILPDAAKFTQEWECRWRISPDIAILPAIPQRRESSVLSFFLLSNSTQSVPANRT